MVEFSVSMGTDAKLTEDKNKNISPYFKVNNTSRMTLNLWQEVGSFLEQLKIDRNIIRMEQLEA